MAFAPLSDLPLGRAHCGVCVRVVRLWDYCGNKEDEPPLHVDMVLVDEKGNRMYAEIPGAEAEKFKLLIKEGQVYVIRKFIVSGGKPAYKPFPNSQMIRFTPWTTVQESDEGGSKIPKYVYNLVGFEELPSRAGQVECVLDVIGVIVGVSEIAHVHLPSTSGTTSKRVISLKDLRNNKVNLVLWGNRAISFDAETVHSIGQQSPVVAVFVGLLVKSYKSEVTLSGGSACKWYINEEISEIEEYFDRVYDQHDKVQWISAGEQQFRALERQQNLEEKTLLQLRDIDPWEFESSGYHCTVTIVRISDKQPWWFASCTKCHRASVVHGSQYKCSGGCPCTTAEPKYRLSVIGTDGTATAEFVLFGRVARQIIGKPVVALIRSSSKNHIGYASDTEHILPEIAALVSQKFTFSVSVTQKSLSQRNVSFQVNGIVALYGKQTCIPKTLDSNFPSGSHGNPVLANRHVDHDNNTDAGVQKKARLSHMVAIPSKEKARSKAGSSNEDEHRTEVLVPTAQTDAARNQTIGDNTSMVHPVGIDKTGPTASPERAAEKNVPADRVDTKQNAPSGRKRTSS